MTVDATSVATVGRWIPMDIYAVPFNVGFGAIVGSAGSGTIRVEHTFDNVFDASITPTAFVHSDVSANSSNIDGNYAYGVSAVRLVVASCASGGSTFALSLIQTGSV